MSFRLKTVPIVFASSAIGSVLGGATNSLVVGLVAGSLGATIRWQIGSAAENRRLYRAP
jgi:uncharacterized membrane protein